MAAQAAPRQHPKPRPGGRKHNRALEAAREDGGERWQPETERRTEPETYRPELCDEVVELGALGMTPQEIAHHWAQSVEVLREWGEAHKAFDAALARARSAAQAWWETQARKAVATRDNKFPAGAWAQVMRARFAEYRERVEVNHNIDITKRLVIVDLTGLPSEQVARGANALQSQQTVRLAQGHTVEGSHESTQVLDLEPLARTEHDRPPADGGHPRGKNRAAERS